MHDDVRDLLSRPEQRFVHDAFEWHVLPFSVGQVRAEQGLGASHLDPIAERARPEAGEHSDVDRANSDAGEHEDDRLAAGGHIDTDAVALAKTQAAQRGGGPAHVALELRVGEHGAVAVLVLTNQGRPAPIARLDVAVHAIPG